MVAGFFCYLYQITQLPCNYSDGYCFICGYILPPKKVDFGLLEAIFCATVNQVPGRSGKMTSIT